MQRFYQNQKGFSLLEVMVAMIIMAIAILGLTAAFVHGRKTVETSKRITIATKLAQDKMESIRNQFANNTSINRLYTKYNNLALNSASLPEPFPNFTFGGRIVAQYAAVNNSGAIVLQGATPGVLLSVDVTVRWMELVSEGVTTPVQVGQSVTLNSVLAE